MAKEAFAAQRTAAESQEKIASLEAEGRQERALARFIPRVIIVEKGERQFLQLEAEEEFMVRSVDYLTANDVNVGSNAIDKSGKEIVIPIDESLLTQIQTIGPVISSYDASANVGFRFHIRKDGQDKQCRHSAVIKPMLRGPAYIRRVIG